jgi:PAS domain S-box-containing protein
MALLHLAHPLTWGNSGIPIWFPPVGIGLVLVAWFGPLAGLLVTIDGLLVVSQACLFGSDFPEHGIALSCADALLGGLEVLLAWWVYHHLAHGARTLSDPRSALLFLVLVIGGVVGLFALDRWLLRLLLLHWFDDPHWSDLLALWLSRALGVLVLAPPLLATLTPLLSRRGWAIRERVDESQVVLRGHVGADHFSRADWLGVAGMAATACVLSVLLMLFNTSTELYSWQLWGVPLVLVIWASLRQGMRGGTVVAGAAAALALTIPVQFQAGGLYAALVQGKPQHADLVPSAAQTLMLVLQGNMFAQCAAALLVAASATWIRFSEARYRQVVAHVPVVVYSARLAEALTPGRTPQAEVTLVSAASGELFGCPPDQLLGEYERWLQRVLPDDREVILAAIAQLTRQHKPVTCEYRLAPAQPKPGSDSAAAPAQVVSEGKLATTPRPDPSRWVRDTLAPHLSPEGRLVGWEGVVTDVTEQRALADDLRRTSSMFHALVANLPAGVFFVQGHRGRPILVNTRARQLLGQREDAWTGLEQLSSAYRLFRADGTTYPVEELPVFQALRRGSTTMRDDIVVHRPDGKRVPLVSWAAPVNLRGSGEPDAAVWVLEDLTALRQAEAARRDTELRLRAVVETMGEGLVVRDSKGSIADCNQAACQIFGHAADEMRGRTPFELDRVYLREDGTPLPPEEHPAQVVLREGRPVRNVILGIRRARLESRGVKIEPHSDDEVSLDGASAGSRRTVDDALPTILDSRVTPSVRWVLVNAMPLGEGANLGGVVTTYSDITAYRQAQEGVRASEEKYRGLIESLPLMLIQSDHDMRVTYANPATRAITGYELHEIADPASWRAIIHPEDLPRAMALGRDALDGKPGRAEVRYRAKDGAEKVSYLIAEPRRVEGMVVGSTTLMVDVTRERLLEEELNRARRLDLLGRLASGIAHDFNNLLSVVLSLTELARASLPEEHPVHADLHRITEAGEQAAGLAAQLLAFSRQRRVTAHRVAINQVVEQTLELLRATLPANIQLEASLGSPDLCILADETQLQQVLMNLCVNARDAMPQGGKLRVQTEAVPGGGNGTGAPADWVRLTVHDEGQGISEQVQQRIFDPYFSTKEHGSGLGLAIVQQIVESYGGRIELTSEPGCGARFDVWWPQAAAEDSAALAPGAGAGSEGEPGRVSAGS